MEVLFFQMEILFFRRHILCAMYAVSFGILLAFDTRFMIMLAAFIVGFPWGGVLASLCFLSLKKVLMQK